MTIADKIKGVFSGHKDTEPTGTTTGTHMGTGTGAGTGEQHSNVTTQQRTVRAPDHHVPDGTAAGRIVHGQGCLRAAVAFSSLQPLPVSSPFPGMLRLTKELSG